MAKRRKKKNFFCEWGQLIRWQNTLVALVCVFIAFKLGDTVLPQPARFLVYLIVGLIFAGGNVLNDFVDVDSDRVGHPKRPLPTGSIARKSALLVGIALLASGLLTDIFCIKYFGVMPVLLGVLAAVLLLFYDFIGGKIPLLGNFIVSLLAGLLFIFAGSVQGLTHGHIFAAGFATFIHLGREIVKDIADREADESVGIRTLSSVIGDRKAAQLASLSMFIVIPLTIIPYFMGVFSEWYLGAVILFADLPILLIAWLLPGNITPHRAKKYAGDIKWIIIGGLFALFLGGISS